MTKTIFKKEPSNTTNKLVQESFTFSNDSTDPYEKVRYKKVIQNAIHWCLVNGFLVVPRELKPTDPLSITYFPFTLYPSPLLSKHYDLVMNLQPTINDITYKIGSSINLMEKNFKKLIEIDPFISSLWTIYQKSLKEDQSKKIHFSILRVDYMLHKADSSSTTTEIKQVEINTMASGLGHISTQMTKLHRNILKWFDHKHFLPKLPNNEPIKKMAQGFVEAWRLYNVKNAIVLFLVLEWEVNLADQRHIEYEIIRQEENIEVHRCTLEEMYKYGRLDENKILYFDNKEVSVVYFRAGYSPDHFKTHKEWDALTKIELSRAVKCPDVATFLTGMKKIQDFLYNEDNELMALCNKNRDLVNTLKSVFAEFLSLKKKDHFERIMKDPGSYVLKPQREGGGNNYYGDEIKDILTGMLNKREDILVQEHGDKYDKDLYITMELLKPPTTENVIINAKTEQHNFLNGNEISSSDINSELGIYGVIVRTQDKVVLNEACGYVMRSKLVTAKEAGVMCGAGAIDSVYLVD